MKLDEVNIIGVSLQRRARAHARRSAWGSARGAQLLRAHARKQHQSAVYGPANNAAIDFFFFLFFMSIRPVYSRPRCDQWWPGWRGKPSKAPPQCPPMAAGFWPERVGQGEGLLVITSATPHSGVSPAAWG